MSIHWQPVEYLSDSSPDRRNGHIAWMGESNLNIAYGNGEDNRPLQSHYVIEIIEDAPEEGSITNFKATATHLEPERDVSGAIMPSHRSANCVASLEDDKIAVFGGFGWSGRHRVSFNDVWTYNSEDGWKFQATSGTPPVARSGAQAVSMGGDIYVTSVS